MDVTVHLYCSVCQKAITEITLTDSVPIDVYVSCDHTPDATE